MYCDFRDKSILKEWQKSVFLTQPVVRVIDLSLVETAAKSLQTELQHSKSQEDAWNNSSLELIRASDVCPWRFLQPGYRLCKSGGIIVLPNVSYT